MRLKKLAEFIRTHAAQLGDLDAAPLKPANPRGRNPFVNRRNGMRF